MSINRPISQGHVQFREYKTWYRIVGNLANTPPGKFLVLMLHVVGAFVALLMTLLTWKR